MSTQTASALCPHGNPEDEFCPICDTQPGQWVCAECAAVNAPGYTTCEACGAEHMVGTTWAHDFRADAPAYVVREWEDGCGNRQQTGRARMLELADAQTGKWITRDYPRILRRTLRDNWYHQS